jgi:hypothetical protein
MGQWGYTPFENDAGLDEAFALLDHLTKKVDRLTCGPRPRGSCILWDTEALAANVELLCLVAQAVYRPAMFVPIRGMPLPAPETIAGWREKFLARYNRLARRQLQGTPAELERFGLEAAAPLVRLAELSRLQLEQSEATHREVIMEVVEARQREAAELSRREAGTEPDAPADRPRE